MKSRSLHFFSGLLFLVVLVCSQASAQTFTGTFVGTVNDQSGAPLAGAAVTITSVETSAARKVITDTSGNFVVPLLPPDNYKIVVELKGFKRAVRESVPLLVCN